jgi:hypothetical protein
MLDTFQRLRLLCWSSLLLLPVVVAAQYNRIVPGNYTSMAYRATDGWLYATAYDIFNLGGTGNYRLVAIDPAAAEVVQTWPLPQIGIQVAVSDDGSMLYCATGDSVWRYNFSSQSFDLKFGHQLPSSQWQYYFSGLVVLPGQPETVVTNWQRTDASSYRTVAVYDGGVIRPNTAERFTSYGAITTDGTTVYAYDTYSSGSNIYPLTLDANGLTPRPEQYNYVRGSSLGIKHFDGRIYGSDGTVVNINGAGGALNQAGHLYTRPNSLVWVESWAPGSDTLYAHTAIGQSVLLQKFDRNNFQLLSELRLSNTTLQYPIDVLAMLGSLQRVAVRSGSKLEIVNRCVSAISNVPDLPSPVQYACYGDTLHLTAPGNFDDDDYFWSNGARGKTFTWPVNDTNPFQLTYQVADAAGCLSAPSSVVSVKPIFPLPAAQIGSTLDNVICPGGFVELTAGGYADERGLTYEWSNGQTGKTIRVETPGAYYCRAVSLEGCRSVPNQFPFYVVTSGSPQPATPTVTVLGGDGDEVVCSADAAKLAGPPGFAVYAWSDGQVSTLNERPLPAGEAPISVQVGNAAGCLSEHSEQLSLERYATPATPTVQRSGALLASSAPVGNQWFLDGNPVPGATEQYFTPAQSGTYTVQVTLNAGCPSAFSEPFSF